MPKESLADVRKKIAALQEREAKMIAAEKGGVIEKIKEAISFYGLTTSDLFGGASQSSNGTKQGRKAAAKRAQKVAKFGDAAGNTWSGRGPRPQWLKDALAAGKSLSDFDMAGHRDAVKAVKASVRGGKAAMGGEALKKAVSKRSGAARKGAKKRAAPKTTARAAGRKSTSRKTAAGKRASKLPTTKMTPDTTPPADSSPTT